MTNMIPFRRFIVKAFLLCRQENSSFSSFFLSPHNLCLFCRYETIYVHFIAISVLFSIFCVFVYRLMKFPSLFIFTKFGSNIFHIPFKKIESLAQKTSSAGCPGSFLLWTGGNIGRSFGVFIVSLLSISCKVFSFFSRYSDTCYIYLKWPLSILQYVKSIKPFSAFLYTFPKSFPFLYSPSRLILRLFLSVQLFSGYIRTFSPGIATFVRQTGSHCTVYPESDPPSDRPLLCFS